MTNLTVLLKGLKKQNIDYKRNFFSDSVTLPHLSIRRNDEFMVSAYYEEELCEGDKIYQVSYFLDGKGMDADYEIHFDTVEETITFIWAFQYFHMKHDMELETLFSTPELIQAIC